MTKMLFTVTAGRTGTRFLYKLMRDNIPGAHCYHERLSWNTHHPGPGVLTNFNHNGMTNEVKSFWATKMLLVHDEIGQSQAKYYVETSHILCKAGLIEAIIGGRMPDREYVIVFLTRDPLKTLLSYHNRHDFEGSKSSTWMWYLDWAYPKIMVNPKKFVEYGQEDPVKMKWCLRLWYLHEMRARQMYYRDKIRPMKIFDAVTIDIEDMNKEAGCMRLFDAMGYEPDKLKIPEPSNTSYYPREVSEPEMAWLKELMEELG